MYEKATSNKAEYTVEAKEGFGEHKHECTGIYIKIGNKEKNNSFKCRFRVSIFWFNVWICCLGSQNLIIQNAESEPNSNDACQRSKIEKRLSCLYMLNIRPYGWVVL